MGALKGLSKKFCEKAIGAAAVIATCAPLVAGIMTPNEAAAQQNLGDFVSQQDVIDAAGKIDGWYTRYSELSDRDGDTASQLYVNMHRHYLNYQGQGSTVSDQQITLEADYLARSYGLLETTAYQNFIGTIREHSDVAQAFTHAIGQHPFEATTNELDAMKYVASLEIQYFASKLLEEITPHFEADRSDPNLYAAYGKFCFMVQELAPHVVALQNSVAPDHGLRSFRPHELRADDFNSSGQLAGATVCPPPARR